MGQAMLEGCETNCQGKIQQRSRAKGHIFFNDMAAFLPLENYHQETNFLAKSMSSRKMESLFLQEIKDINHNYIEFINALFTSRNKFNDKIFPADSQAFTGCDADGDWARLSEMNQSLVQIYKATTSGGKSKTFQLLEAVTPHLGDFLPQIEPAYIHKVGFAICKLYINGQKEEVVIDDFIPVPLLKYFTAKNGWYFLVEKALAKVLGSYSFIDELSPPELFQQITGLPFDVQPKEADRISRQSRIYHSSFTTISEDVGSFKDAIESESACYLPAGQDSDDIYSLHVHKGFIVEAFPVNPLTYSTVLFKITVDRNTKASIRLSFLNKKLFTGEEGKGQPKDWTLKLYQQQGNEYTSIQQKTSARANCLYLGKTFVRFKPGHYVLSLRCEAASKRVNLVAYRGEGCKIKEVTNRQTARDITEKINMNENTFKSNVS